MGVDVVVGGAGDEERAAVERLFHLWDRTFSRFRPESELNAVNASPSATILVSPLFARALGAALDAAAATDGLVDPTVGAAVLAAGYDRDFSLLRDDDSPPGEPQSGCWSSLALRGRLLARPPGVVLDLNGVVKSLVVDEAAGTIARGFAAAGGDLAVTSPVEAELPDGGSITVRAGGLATSGTTRRRWLRGGTVQHHLIDPRTGAPADSCWMQVTVAAATCLAADVAAKAAFLLSDDGPDWLDERGLPGRFVADGEVVVNRSWAAAVPDGGAPVAA